MIIPQSWQAHGVLPEHLQAFKALALEYGDFEVFYTEAFLERLPPQLKELGLVYNNETHAEFTGCRDEEGDVFFLDLDHGRVVLGIGWYVTQFAAESFAIDLRQLVGVPMYISLYIREMYYR